MNKFEKVSYEQFRKDMLSITNFTEEDIEDAYDEIKLPTRSTSLSAGYDFYSPISFSIYPTRPFTVPTGIRVCLDTDKVLALFPRSGMGFKYGMTLANTTGIIDSDYYGATNEGHIMAKLCVPHQHVDNNGFVTSLYIKNEPLNITAGDKFMQGIILQYFKTDDDNATGIRTGGMGSTGR